MSPDGREIAPEAWDRFWRAHDVHRGLRALFDLTSEHFKQASASGALADAQKCFAAMEETLRLMVTTRQTLADAHAEYIATGTIALARRSVED